MILAVSLEVTAAIVSAAAAVVTLLVPAIKVFKAVRRNTLLTRYVGANDYDSETIEESTKYYVQPFCSSLDPAEEAEIRLVIPTEDMLFQRIDKHLAKGSSIRHILVLADSGMGKTSFVLNYFVRNQLRSKKNRHKITIFNLSAPTVDDRISAVDDKRNTVLMLDAFDEDPRAIVDYRSRITELMHICREFRRVIITSRTQFFPTNDEIPRETGILIVGPRSLGDRTSHMFWKLYLSPLTDEQVSKYIWKRYPLWAFLRRAQARQLVKSVPYLSMRPMLLTYLPFLLQAKEPMGTPFEIYGVLVKRWLERESPRVDETALRAFSKRLALDIFIHRVVRKSERISYQQLAPLPNLWYIPLADWQIRGRSLLNRDALGNYKFAHRSIMEFFVAEVLITITRSDLSQDAELLRQHLGNRLLTKWRSGENISLSPIIWKCEGLTDQIEGFVRQALEDRDETPSTVKSHARNRIIFTPAEIRLYRSEILSFRSPPSIFCLKQVGIYRNWTFSIVTDLSNELTWALLTKELSPRSTGETQRLGELDILVKDGGTTEAQPKKRFLPETFRLPTKQELDRMLHNYPLGSEKQWICDFHRPLERGSTGYQTLILTDKEMTEAEIRATSVPLITTALDGVHPILLVRKLNDIAIVT